MITPVSVTKPALTARQLDFMRRFSLVFWLAFALTVWHIADDTLIGEPSAWRLSVAAYWNLNAAFFLLLPALGWMFARRRVALGFVITLLFGLLALFGAGTDHLRHLTSDFRGPIWVTDLLAGFGIGATDLSAGSLQGTLYWLLGLATSQPHAHSLTSSLLIVISAGVYILQVVASAMGLWIFRRNRPQVQRAHTTSPAECMCGMMLGANQNES